MRSPTVRVSLRRCLLSGCVPRFTKLGTAMAQGRATIKDVAAAAGVSTTTVSHVLNDVPGKRISSDTRVRVFDAAGKLDYAANALARSLRTQRSNTIAIIGGEIATTPFAGKIILGA